MATEARRFDERELFQCGHQMMDEPGKQTRRDDTAFRRCKAKLRRRHRDKTDDMGNRARYVEYLVFTGLQSTNKFLNYHNSTFLESR